LSAVVPQVPQPAPPAEPLPAGGPPAPVTPAARAAGDRALAVPPVVRRNTLLLATSQAIVGAGTQMIPSLGAIMALQLGGSAALVGLASGLLGVSQFLVAYPIGQLTDRRGRVVGILTGQAVSLVGALLLGACVVAGSFPLFVVGMIVFGLGVGAGQQLRLAAADMFLPARRAEGLGYVLTGSLIGVLGGPVLIAIAEWAGVRFGVPTVAVAWWLVPALILPGMALVARVRPDPREIARHLSRYYPGYTPPPAPAVTVDAPVGLLAWLRYSPTRTAYVALATAQGSMAVMMTITPVALSHHGHTLTAISVSVALHVVGMFGFSLPLGRLSDRIGRRATMLAGTAVCAAGALLVPLSPDYIVATAGIFLVGLGWSAATVAATARIADVVPAEARGRAVGAGDTLVGITSVVCPLLAGPAVLAYGLAAVVPLVLLPLIPAALLLLRPGGRDDPGLSTA
jgi:MFS family permease